MDFAKIKHTSRQLASTFESLMALGVTKRCLFDAVLRETVTSSADIYGCWCVWEPDAFDGRDVNYHNAPGHDATGRYIPFWFRENGTVKVEPNTNYNDPALGEYYVRPKATGCELTRPNSVYYPLSGQRMILSTHIVPLFREGSFVGVAGVDVLPSRMDQKKENDPSENLPRLSRRELEVHHWLVEGKTNYEIGILLGISSHTVKKHVEKILHKTGMESRHALAIQAARRSPALKYAG